MNRQTAIIGLMSFALATPLCANVIFVDSSARGEDTGTSWQDAFNNLQDALDAAQPGFEIWVANGAYVPERDREGVPTTGPEATFVLKYPDVRVLGGFAGDEGDADQRDPLFNPTVIEGEGQKWHLVFADDKFAVDTSTRFDGFVLHGGYADGIRREDGFGGGMMVINAGITVVNCTFADNFAKFGGGGLYHEGPPMNVVNCRFIDNAGGDNAAGGGLYAIGPIELVNCLFAGNTLGDLGHGAGAALLCNAGGFCVEPEAIVASCTFTDNQVLGESGFGGGLFAMPHTRVVNSIVWANFAPQQPSIGFSFVGPIVTYSDVEGGFPGEGNIAADPLFANPAGGAYALTHLSPCADIGNPAGLPLDFADLDNDGETEESLPLDLDLTPRQIGLVNLGCFETFDCDGDGVGDYIELARCDDDPLCSDCNGNSVPDGCDGAIARIYVDIDAIGSQTGESWQNAYVQLFDALCAASVPGSQVHEIWVRRGTYVPELPGKGTNPYASFHLLSNVAIYGGFAGLETDLSQRNIAANETILSGDLLPGGLEDNSYHVVTAQGVNPSAVLDGFTVSGGNAVQFEGEYPYGGGLLVVDAGATVRNCTFRANQALSGGGAAAALGIADARLVNCVFVANAAPLGSAVSAIGGPGARSRVSVVNSVLQNNSNIAGGPTVMAAGNVDVFIESCTITQNAGPTAVAVNGGLISARNSIVWGNFFPDFSAQQGGGISVRYCDVQGGASGEGNIRSDPLFISSSDFQLRSSSPCIDAGDPLAAPADVLDIGGLPRVGQCRTDMGAYESPFFADCDGNNAGDACEIAANGLTDSNHNFRLDRCEPGFVDCNHDGISDSVQPDADRDGVIDACDGCPNDAAKSVAGACGCGNAETDGDGDGVPDCVDNCPTRPNPDQRDGNSNGAGDACDSLLHLSGCPGNLQVASGDSGGANVTFVLPQALDGYGEVRLTSTKQPGELFLIGDTTVTVTATDTAGGFATCSFQVTVIEPAKRPMPPPDPNCPPLYRAQGGALRFLGIPFGCGPGCLVAVPLTLAGILGMKRRRGRRA